MRKLFTLLALGIFVTTLTACNTMEGAGEDMSEAGEAISDSAD
jgi:predicted small secreted protein